MIIGHQEAEILAWEVNPNANPNMKIGLRAHVYIRYNLYPGEKDFGKESWSGFNFLPPQLC